MSQAISPSAGYPYGLARVCRVWTFARSTVYHRRDVARRPDRELRKRGPKKWLTDAELLGRVRFLFMEAHLRLYLSHFCICQLHP